MSFSLEWLALREPYDQQARSRSIRNRAMSWPMTRVIDLGAGTGSTLRSLASSVPVGTEWTLVDHSLELLRALPGEGERIQMDLAQHLPTFDASCLVTASAFFDLVSAPWIERLVAALNGAALYSALDVDGHHRVDPEHRDDDWVFEGFAAHQTGTDKGFGTALGPKAHRFLERTLASAGYTVFSAPSDWQVQKMDMAEALLSGIADAAGGAHGDRARAQAWLEQRLEQENLRITVGHRDLFAVPR